MDLSIDFDSIKKHNNVWSNLPNNKLYYKYSKIFDRRDSFKFDRRCNSVKHSYLSNISFLDSSQIGKDSYIEQRKEYILRYLFTRNKNRTLYKRIKKKVDKNV